MFRISMLRRISIAAVVIWPFGLASEGNAQDASACWMVFGEQQATYGRSSADEMICLKSQTSGEVIESSIFGSVGGCSKVTVNREGYWDNLCSRFFELYKRYAETLDCMPVPDRGDAKMRLEMVG